MIPNRASLLTAGLSLAALLITGCGTTDEAKYVDPKGPRTIVSLDQINIQDWTNAADQMVNSLLASGVLARSPQQPAVLAISRIVNNTTQQVDTDMLTKKIRVALNQSGKVVTTTTTGMGGKAEDPLAKEAAAMARFMNDEKPQPLPTYSLSGKLIEDRAQAGNTKQVTFVFQLALTEISTGNAVWEDEVQIAKQGSRPAVGW